MLFKIDASLNFTATTDKCTCLPTTFLKQYHLVNSRGGHPHLGQRNCFICNLFGHYLSFVDAFPVAEQLSTFSRTSSRWLNDTTLHWLLNSQYCHQCNYYYDSGILFIAPAAMCCSYLWVKNNTQTKIESTIF